MQLQIQGHGTNITQRFDNYVRSKIDRIERHLPGVEDVRLQVSRQGAKTDAPKSLELTVRRKRTVLRVEELNSDIYKGFDSVLDKMDERIQRYKGRAISRKRSGQVAEEEVHITEAEVVEGETDEQKLVRIKTFSLTPMSTDEAIEQMELIGHDFFAFVQQDGGAINVVYRRKGNTYGLLQPER